MLFECHDTFKYRPPATNVRWGRTYRVVTQEREWVMDPLTILRAGRGSGNEMLSFFGIRMEGKGQEPGKSYEQHTAIGSLSN